MQMKMDPKLALRSLSETDMYSPHSIDNQDMFSHEQHGEGPTILDISSSKSSQFLGFKQGQEFTQIKMDPKLSLQSLSESDVYSPCSMEHQDVFMYDDERRGEIELSASKSSQFPGIKQEPDHETLMSWTQKHPEHWSQNEILDWIYFVAGTIDVDPTTIRGEGFQNITGPELCRMSLDDFQKRDPVNGKCFFDMFRVLHKDAYFIEPQTMDFPCLDQQSRQYNLKYLNIEPNISQEPPSSEQLKLFDIIVPVNENEMKVKLGEYWYPIGCPEQDEFLYQRSPADAGFANSDSESVSDTSDRDSPAIIYNDYVQRSNSTGSDGMSDDDYNSMSVVPPSTLEPFVASMAQKRKTGSQRKKNMAGDQDKQQNRGRKPGQISKGNHLWEFIRDLLKDPKFNPHLLRWEEKETGVFRFVQSEAVAQMWGRKKNNPGMTYEKLSRAMRFCRTAGYFAEVPKTGKFPKKLCFRFGPKAYGWEG